MADKSVINFYLFGLQESGSISFNGGQDTSVSCILTHLGYNVDNYYFAHNGYPVQDLSLPLSLDQEEKDNGIAIIRASPRLLGGKGGFGALIRAMGMRVNKNRTRDASRDLSGRRIRDVNAEKQLAEWAKKEPERQKKKEEEKAKKRKMLLEGPKHFFNDPEYMQQLEDNEVNLDQAVRQGLNGGAGCSSNGSRKREREGKTKEKKKMLTLGIEELSSDDSETENEEEEEEGEKEETVPVKKLKMTINENEELPKLTDYADKATPITPPTSNTTDELVSVTQTSTSNCQSISTNTQATTETPPPATASTDTCTPSSPPPQIMSDQGQPRVGDTNGAEIDQETINKFDLDKFESVEELEAVGPHLLKAVLQKLGLKCGGTLSERAHRLYSVKGLTVNQIDPSLFAGKTNGKRKNKGKGKNTNK